MSIYKRVGIKRVVNALGASTMLGGSVMSPEVWEAMREADVHYVDMEELHVRAGEFVAKLVGAEAAYITPGASAAIHAAAAVCIAGGDPVKIMQLPDTTGLRTEIIVHRRLQYIYGSYYYYLRGVQAAGGKLVLVGGDAETSVKDIEAVINNKTAAIHFHVFGGDSPEGFAAKGEEGLEDTIKIGKKHNLPVIVDAAHRVLPVDYLRRFLNMGADLVCYGGKYIGGPSASGFLCGRKELIKALLGPTSVQWPHSRGLKMDKWAIIALVVALERWIKTDHTARSKTLDEKARVISRELNRIPGIKAELISRGSRFVYPLNHVVKVKFEAGSGLKAAEVVRKLTESDPSIRVGYEGDSTRTSREEDSIFINTSFLLPGDEEFVVEGLRRVIEK